MRHLVVILLGLVFAGGVGYFIGYDHGFQAIQRGESFELNSVGVAATTMSRIVGKWQSTEDPAFIREIRNDGSVIDRYEGHDDVSGFWMVFTKEVPDTAFPYTYGDGIVYLSIAFNENEKLYYSVVRADDSLELVYLDRGGVLSFKRIP